MEDISGLDFVVGLLQQLGMYPIEDDGRITSCYARYASPGVMVIFTASNVIVQCVNIYLTWEDVDLITEHAMAFLLYTFVLFKMDALFDEHKMVAIVRKFQRMNENIATDHNREMFKKEDRINVKIMKLGMIAVLSAAAILYLGMFVVAITTGKVPFHRWYPVGAETTLIFELVTASLFLFTWFDTFYIIATDIALMFFIHQTVVQLRMLRHTLQNLGAITEEKIQQRDTRRPLLFGTKSFRLGLTFVGQLMADRIPNCTLDVIGDEDRNLNTDEIDREKGLLPTSIEVVERRREIKIEPNLRCETNKEMGRALTACVVHHQQLIALTKDINSTFSVMLSFQVIINALTGFSGLYISTMADSVDVKVLTVAASILIVTLELFIFCWFADQLTNESLLISDAAYASDWVDASDGFKRSIRIIMDRAQKPLFIRAAGIPLSRRTFRALCKSGYYLQKILNKMYFGEKFIQNPNQNISE